MALFAGNVLPHRDFNHRAIPPPVRRNPVHDAAKSPSSAIIATDIPARLDALPFGRFHLLVIAALGITWILDGLEVTLAGALSGELKQSSALALSNAQIGLAGSCYLAGAVLGAVFFGWLTDRLGRKKLFTITLAIYLVGDRGHRPVMGRVELRRVPLSHRRRHRRRIHRHQFDNPGAYSGSVPRLDRPPHQRQLLAWRGNGRGRFARPARSGIHRSGDRLAAGVPDRRNNRTRYFGHATLDSGKPALAGDARLPAGGARGRPRHRSAILRAAALRRCTSGQKCGCACAITRRCARSPARCS